jgi:hypothetical protein
MAFTPRRLMRGASGAGGSRARSLRFNSADSAYLNRTPASAGNRRTWTWSGWVKRSALSGGNYPQLMSADGGTYGSKIGFFDGDYFWVDVGQGSTYTRLTSTAVYRDVSAWYHIVVAQDTTQATETNRVKVYINGSQITISGTWPTQNFDGSINNNSAQNIGRESTATYYSDVYMTEVYMVDGQALTPSSFGETNADTGVWQPKAYTGTYGTNGFYLNFSDNSNTTATTLGRDYSGNGNNWTPNNFSVSSGVGNDSVVDVPTSFGTDTGVGGNVRGNYCTWNPLSNSGGALVNGNLQFNGTSSPFTRGNSTIAVSSGKWYFEANLTTASSSTTVGIGQGFITDKYPGQDALSYAQTLEQGSKINNNVQPAYGVALTSGDIFMCAFDLDNNKIFFGRNGTWFDSSNPVTGTSPAYTLTAGTYCPIARPYSTGGVIHSNFGQRPFAYTAPSGFKALCTTNLPTPTIGATTATQSGKFFNTVLYNGTNQTAQNITGVGFQPDFTWIKWRVNTYYHNLFDVLRGVNNVLSTNVAVAEGIRSGTLTSFNSDGFSLGNDSTYSGVNVDATSYVAWNWKAGGTGVNNTSGQISSTVSANPTAGFSIVTFTADGTTKTVGHGLGVKPSLIIVKVRNGSGSWITMTDIITGSMQYGVLNSTAAFANIGYSAPTSTVFQYNDNNGNTQVAYCFASIEGYSKIGTYTGNGNTNRNFVYLGFTPALILVKRTSSSGTNWRIVNPRRVYLSPNTSDTEYASYPGPFLQTANGFEISAGDDVNENGGTFIYAAFASSPFKYALAQ